MEQACSSWRKVLLVNFLVATILVIVALLCMEGYLRLTIPSSSGGSIYESTLATRRYKVMKPDSKIIAWGSEFRTNNLGFRDARRDIPAKGTSGFRVIVLGDSFTTAAGVDFDKIFTSLLDKDLKQRVPGTDVINLAVGGYNILQYELVLQEVGLSLEPDVVVVAVFPFNDLENGTYRANREDAEGRSRPTQHVWFRELYVYRAFLARIEARVKNLLALDVRVAPAAGQGAAASSTDSEDNLSALDRIVATAAAHDMPVVIALLPNTDEPGLQSQAFAPFRSRCANRGWECVDLLQQFVAAGDNLASMRINLLDPHPDARYNARVAEFMSDSIASAIRSVQQRRAVSTDGLVTVTFP
jgi:hypothetical protein